jgi:(1->4)-alpha-D-glucan 1-alpha-D-glucosylmutase
LLVEKILARDEHLRTDWAVHGTTGYEFANQAVALLVDQRTETAMTETYQRFAGIFAPFRDLACQSKLLVMRSAMASEINVLGNMLSRLSETNRWYRDFTLNALTGALREVISCFPVYRTYLTPDESLSEQGRKVVSRALDLARRRNPALERSVFEFLREVLLPTPGSPHAVLEEPRREFVMKFQQCSGPVAAKGIEDTAFYIYNRLVALNEVGGEPGEFGASVETFHNQQWARFTEFPHSMVATSTHDTKRSEDVRARIAAISELPAEWARVIRRWHVSNRKYKRAFGGEAAPDNNEEYLLYQTLVGSWPLEPLDAPARDAYRKRIQQYMEKAGREAKVNTSWIAPNEDWDSAVRDFTAAILTPKTGNRFLPSLEVFAAEIAQLGAINALTQLVWKTTVPGVPDFYQGNEIWDFSLVDPDNRRPVDYEHRRRLLVSLGEQPNPTELLENWKDGRIKLFVTRRLLHFRRDHPDLFGRGDYVAATVTGTLRASCVAFTRAAGGQRILVATPRLSSRVGFPPLGERWKNTSLSAPGSWRNLFTGAELSGDRLALADVFREFPVAVLVAIS